MPMNQFASQQEVIFITYEDTIKTTKLYILKKLLTADYKPYYKDFINFSKIEGKSDEELMGIIISATTKNILEYLAIQPFDYDVTYTELLLEHEDVISKSKLLTLGDSINILLKQKFLKHIYIYSQYYDKRIHNDVVSMYGTTNVSYVTGEFSDVINDIAPKDKVTSYILNDIDFIKYLLDNNKISYTNILLGNYGYNYKFNSDKIPVLKIDNIDEIIKERICKLGIFDPDNTAKYVV